MTISGISQARLVLDGLLKDNDDYVNGQSVPQSQSSSAAVRNSLAVHGQAPVVAMVTCADSRVAPEIIFGAGIGKLFVIRNAGNVVTEVSVQASLEYAVTHLKIPLVMVVGHSKCGAITAAINVAKQAAKSKIREDQKKEDDEDDETDSGSDDMMVMSPLGQYVTSLSHVVKDDVDMEGGAKNDVAKGIETNVHHGVNLLKFGNGPIADAYASGAIDIVGAVYDIHNGKVSIIEE